MKGEAARTMDALIALADEANARIASCHERRACPTCHAYMGEPCKHKRTGKPLKHPHEARWTPDVPER